MLDARCLCMDLLYSRTRFSYFGKDCPFWILLYDVLGRSGSLVSLGLTIPHCRGRPLGLLTPHDL